MSVLRIASSSIGKILTTVAGWLGLATLSFAGYELILNQASSYVVSQLGSIGGDLAGLLGLFGFDIAISMILSAFTARVAVLTLSRIGKR